MTENIELNHQSATVLPYYVGDDGKIWIVLERKDPEFKKDYFNSALNFIGGNWFPNGTYRDLSPEDTLYRNIKDEFGLPSPGKDGLDIGLRDNSYDKEPETKETLPEDIQKIGEILIDEPTYQKTYQVFVDHPEIKENLVYGSSIFYRQLDKDQYEQIKSTIKKYEGTITTDNVLRGSKLEIMPLEGIKNEKFAWGYDQILNELMHAQTDIKVENIPLKDSIKVNVMLNRIPGKIKLTDGCPTYNDIENAGYSYKR